ncbi:MAG: hypothetical protein IPJ03_16615 [Ignavibacteriales bacterium]|nr:hypothetical protein [Ignavibacteriales bacterium]
MTNWDIDDPMNILSLKSLGKLSPTSSKMDIEKDRRYNEILKSFPVAKSFSELAEQIIKAGEILKTEYGEVSNGE